MVSFRNGLKHFKLAFVTIEPKKWYKNLINLICKINTMNTSINIITGATFDAENDSKHQANKSYTYFIYSKFPFLSGNLGLFTTLTVRLVCLSEIF